jgi:uncharacterized membrane protein
MASRSPKEGPAPRLRLSGIDWLRGLVMVLMLIDHTRDFVHAESCWHRPTDLSVISSATFLTRWITHCCAPIFVFLAGTSVALQLQAGKTLAAVSRFLWTRGLWLVFLELTLVHLGMTWNWTPLTSLGIAQVIWVLGLCMLLMAALLRLPWAWILTVSLVLVLGHNLLDPMVAPAWGGPGAPAPGIGASLWAVLHQGGNIAPFGGQGPVLRIVYPLIPWPGVMGLGYCLGRLFEQGAERRRSSLTRLGLAALALFVLLRSLNLYGDASRWALQATPFRTLLSFLNTTKYPPSLLYLSMTIGPGLLLLAWREGRTDQALDRVLITFGRVPMFFYLLQWPTAHGMGVLLQALAGKDWRYAIHEAGACPPDYGFRLGVVYLAWALGLALLYPLCRWFAGVKARRKDWWLSYL